MFLLQVVDCFVEIYEHLTDLQELRKASQCIVDWLAISPIIDWEVCTVFYKPILTLFENYGVSRKTFPEFWM